MKSDALDVVALVCATIWEIRTVAGSFSVGLMAGLAPDSLISHQRVAQELHLSLVATPEQSRRRAAHVGGPMSPMMAHRVDAVITLELNIGLCTALTEDIAYEAVCSQATHSALPAHCRVVLIGPSQIAQ
jgi:hypothetical protein